MGITSLLQPPNILRACLLALSIFNLVAFLWLAFTVWLNGDRKAGIARLGVVGLGLSALFFFNHALLISGSSASQSALVSQDFLWHLIWLPALGVPYIWFAIGLYYAALINQGWRRRRPYLLVIGALLGATVLVCLLLNPSTFTYAGALQLVVYNDALNDIRNGVFSPPVLLSLLFLCYVTFCAIAPWFTIGRISRLLRAFWHFLNGRTPRARGLRIALIDAFWDDPRDKEQLEEPHLSWHLARPGLLLAAVLMVLLTTTLGVLVIQNIVNWLQHPYTAVAPARPINVGPVSANSIPMNLLILDLCATGAVALVILLIGYSIMRHGILIERSLSRRGFLEQWRGTVIVSAGVSVVIVLLVNLTHSSLGGLLIITTLATAAYALFTWSSYTAHDRYIALLGPFVRSTSLHHWLNTDLQKTEQDLEDLFYHLCHNVLGVQCAYLAVLAGSVRRRFSYRWPVSSLANGALFSPVGDKKLLEKREANKKGLNGVSETPSRIQLFVNEVPMICWVLPIYDERGLVATLYLGPRKDGAALTDEDMNLAHACGQRILDTLGDHEAMQAVAGLLRRRIVDVKLLGAQQRRVLHDEILPQMHLALLQLETLRSHPANGATPSQGETDTSDQAVDETIALITDTHRRLAAMMRATAPSAPHRLEQDGMISAIRTMLEQDFQYAFDEVEWCVSDETAASIDEVMPPAIAELVFAAVQEALRNAARHARGSDEHRQLRLLFKASWNEADHSLEVSVADDGVGISAASSATSGTGGGLLTHSALLAIAGGNLTIKSASGEGVTVRILLPAGSLR
ncbi:MAG TPA: ATP-binding protein [Ktedonobacteraceae bacterium]